MSRPCMTRQHQPGIELNACLLFGWYQVRYKMQILRKHSTAGTYKEFVRIRRPAPSMDIYHSMYGVCTLRLFQSVTFPLFPFPLEIYVHV
jgi:hypothetical protein